MRQRSDLPVIGELFNFQDSQTQFPIGKFLIMGEGDQIYKLLKDLDIRLEFQDSQVSTFDW